MTLTQAIQDEALRLGFALVGVTSPAPLPHFQVFEEWLSAGRHAGMAYLEKEPSRQRRSNPKYILPDCRSILVLGMRCPPSLAESTLFDNHSSSVEDSIPSKPYRGRIACYAWGEDYHLTIPPRLQSLIAFIESQMGMTISHCAYTDSGPVLERDLAQRAGLGWIGKNTNLIHPQMGSYLLLAEILLSIDLDFNPPFQHDRCGSCRRCLEACPTQCILPNRTLDSSRCIAYLTIENKGAIPVTLRSKVGDWIFGCDICQQVCPWNRRSNGDVTSAAFEYPASMTHPDLIKILSLTPESFALRFRGSPVKRARYAGFLRNAAVALGNRLAEYPSSIERPAAINVLKEVLRSNPQPLARGHAAWALGRAGEHNTLRQAAIHETDPTVLEEIHSAEMMPG
jgi:epoxyqueuosine reductase